MRQAPTCTGRPKVCTTVRYGAPPGSGDPFERSQGDIELDVTVLLPSIEPQLLIEVALGVEQPDSNQRHAEVGGGLAVIAGQNAEAAGVDGHRVVEPELGTEVGDRPID